jgi:DNA polymerase
VPTDKAKDKAGKRLIHLFTKPLGKNRILDRATSATHPDEWAEFVEYARLDVEAMRSVYTALPTWNLTPSERSLWLLDQRINDRGVAVDRELAAAALHAAQRAGKALAAEISSLTGGAVLNTTQRDKTLDHLRSIGLVAEDLKKGTVNTLLKGTDISPEVRAMLEIRLQAAATSPAKYRTLLQATSSDGRLRGTLQFCGATRTGRWGGRLFQPQNLPRPTLKQSEIDLGIAAMKADAEDILFGNVMELCTSAVRGCLVAPEGKKLVIADLSNIEGRMLAFLAGEDWKLDAFRDFDKGIGPDLYKLAYAKSFGIKPEDVTKDQRQLGKVQELALGYQGGLGAFSTMAALYGMELPEDTINDLVTAWRKAHPRTKSFWYDCENAARNAIRDPDAMFQVGKLMFRMDDGWLRMVLPSGRSLCYPNAEISDGKIAYEGVNQYTRKWERLETYGGKLVENATQAASRDILVTGMMAAEKAGYEVVLHVHDELICETPDSELFAVETLGSELFAVDKLAGIMATGPQWSVGLPLAAAGFETHRYRKDG